MDYGMIGKIEKAKRYAQERDRITFQALDAEFRGDNNSYSMKLTEQGWTCTCPGFKTYGICPHIMTLEKELRPMLKRDPLPYAPGQNVVSDVEKAKRYSTEPERIRFHSFSIAFRGDNNTHQTTFDHDTWNCNCDFFKSRSVCCHTMALERVLTGMIEAAPQVVE